jgi:hypothetical protein
MVPEVGREEAQRAAGVAPRGAGGEKEAKAPISLVGSELPIQERGAVRGDGEGVGAEKRE